MGFGDINNSIEDIEDYKYYIEAVVRDALIESYLHFVWGTWDRLPLITPQNEKYVYEAILAKCVQLGSSVIALSGMPDHVHLFVRFPATISIADFIKEVKGSTSHLVNHLANSDEFFKWQGGYAVFSVSKSQVDRIKAYILNQKEHHKNNQLEAGIEP